MHPKLLESLAQFEEHFRHDARCLRMFLHGSIGRNTTDEYSDVDVSIVVRDEHYARMTRELRPLCENICGPIVAWLPEGESDGYCNYAFLFEHGQATLLYDFAIVQEQRFQKGGMHEDAILFSRMDTPHHPPAKPSTNPFPPQTLARLIDNYWVYAYLCGKYHRRGDLFKLIYVRDVLFQTHLKVLNHLYSDHTWQWWAGDIQNLPAEKREPLLLYFGNAALDDLRIALARQLTLFAHDATEACEKYQLSYPTRTEIAVRKHLHDMGAVLPS